MKTVFRTTQEIIDAEFCKDVHARAPLPPDVIPNRMGINLASVEGMSWTRQPDGQLVSLTIHLIPVPAS